MKKEHLEILNSLKAMEATGALDRACFSDVPIEVYHHPECPGVSSTQIKAVLKKSVKYWEHEKAVTKDCFRFGNAFHSFVNEPHIFQETYQIIPDRFSGMLAAGKVALKDSDFKLIQAMQVKLFQHPDAARLLTGARFEETYFIRDKETGIHKKCRLDAFKNWVISDLKSTRDASADSFARDCRIFLYRVSAAYYSEIVSEFYDRLIKEFFLIACEKEGLQEVATYRVSDRSLEIGAEEVRRGLRKINRVRELGAKAWTGYELGIKEISI